jgi:predicted PurR-regulated permease PerM
MELLRNLFGNVMSGIIRLAVAVGVIAAVGFFIVKPVLDTTEHGFDTVNEALKESGINDVSKTIGVSNRRVQRQIQRQINHSFRVSQQTGNSQKLIRCIQRAQPNVKRIERCTVKY